ncbi:TlpA family protein disulfide reductase [Flavivirga jejuensis]|uniref:TlpA disulfide reductase family protein n=1 Tax=Flavivirga jejuensis TaxID=870487 RepID=A0ABT8WR20_9FLAO|nr:TlpA disulfide reductase family protein [Flavivirga jejuensis]MDO5975628.1 TlpA disulfide reductase family protein [Flavivirga jejuensis]
MKNTVIILLSTLFLGSCQSNSPKDYILFSGTISDAPLKEFRLVHKDGKGRFTVKTTADGSFFCDTIFSGTGTYRFSGLGMNRIDIYFTNGGEYNLKTNGKDMRNTSVLTGTSPNASKFLLTKDSRIKRLRGDFEEYNNLNESDFSAKATMIKENLIKYLDSFPGIPKDFAQFERQELINYHLLSLIRYQYRHGHNINEPNFRVSKDFLKPLEGVDYVNEEAYKHRGWYDELVEEYFELKADELADREGIDRYLAKLKVFGAIPNGHIKNDLLRSASEYDIAYTDNMDAYYNTFLSVSTSIENDKSITDKYEALKKLSRGEPSPVFTNYVNNSGGTSSLSDFRGKYVYIDVWATWCGPCLAEVPSLKKVEKQYHGKNIEFVSISIDVEKKRAAWSKMITDKELGGVQLLADKDWNTDFIKSYKINSIPRFILLDPKGNIVSWNAPRPSNPDLITLFNELNI